MSNLPVTSEIEITSEVSRNLLLIASLNYGSLLIPTDALTPIPNKDSSISTVNFLINFFFINLLIRLYNTEALIPSFLDNIGTEIDPSKVNS